MSFVSKLNALKVRLENNQALANYVGTYFEKSLTVKRVFKNRVEINMADLPLILITAPKTARTKDGNAIYKERTVRLYIGFYQMDYEKAQDNLIEIEELVETAAVTKTNVAGDVPMPVFVQDSLNDEGIFHPSYFEVMDLLIKEK